MKSAATHVAKAPAAPSLGERISAIGIEADSNRRAVMVSELSYDDRMSIKAEMHSATDPIRRNVLAGILEAANLEDQRRMIASQAAQHQQQQVDAARRKAERLAKWGAEQELVRALFLQADTTRGAVGEALLGLARRLQVDTSQTAPPETFE